MPVIPNYQQRTSLSQRSSGPRFTPDQFYNPAGDRSLSNSFSQAADAVTGIGVSIARQEQKRTEAANRALIDTRRTQDKLFVVNAEADYKNQHIELLDSMRTDGMGQLKQRFENQLAISEKSTLGVAPTDEARDMLALGLASINGSLLERATQYQRIDLENNAKVYASQAADKFAVGVSVDPSTYDQAIQNMKRLDSDVAGLFTESEMAAFRQQNMAKLVSAKITSESRIDPEAAQKTLLSEDSRNSLTLDEFESLQRTIDSQMVKVNAAREKERLVGLVAQTVKAGYGVMDPKNADNVEAVGTYFSSLELDQAMLNQEPAAIPQLVDIAKSTGILPPQGAAILRGAFSAGDDRAQVYAATALSALELAAPSTLNKLDTEDIIRGQLISKYTRAGVSPANAIIATNKQLNPASKEITDKRIAEVKKLSENDDLRDLFTKGVESNLELGLFGGLEDFTDLPQNIQDNQLQKFKDAYQNYYVLSGDQEISVKNAVKDLSKVFNVTKADSASESGRYMEYPPEQYFGLNRLSKDQNSAWMAEQLTAVARNYGVDVDKTAVLLTPDATTSSRVKSGLPPNYAITVKDDVLGERLLTDADGRFIRYAPDNFAQSIVLTLEDQVTSELLKDGIAKDTAKAREKAKQIVQTSKQYSTMEFNNVQKGSLDPFTLVPQAEREDMYMQQERIIYEQYRRMQDKALADIESKQIVRDRVYPNAVNLKDTVDTPVLAPSDNLDDMGLPAELPAEGVADTTELPIIAQPKQMKKALDDNK